MEKTVLESLENIKQNIVEIKGTLSTKVDNSAEKLEIIERAVSALTQRVDQYEAEKQRKSTDPIEMDSPQANFIRKEYGNVPFNALMHNTVAHAGDNVLANLQTKADYVYLLGLITYYSKLRSGNVLGAQYTISDAIRSTNLYKQFSDETAILRKALSTGAAGSGAEYIPTGFSADLVERVVLGLRVAALHRTMIMPRNPYELPGKIATKPMGFKVSERTSDNVLTEANRLPAVSLGTRKVTFSAVGLGGLAVFSGEQEEDSIVPMLPFTRDEIVAAIQNAQETATINGSLTATHEDYDVETDVNKATRPETSWDGYRVLAIKPSTDTKLDLSTFNETNLRALRALMGKYGAMPSELAWVTSIKVVLGKMLSLGEVTTLDKFGPQAVVLNGQLASFDGIPIIVSEYSRDDVSATGFNTVGGPNTDSTVIIVHRPSYMYGRTRDLRVQEIMWGLTDQVVVVAKMRVDFEALHVPTTETSVAMGYSIYT